MLLVRKPIKKPSRHYSLRKKVHSLKKTSNDKKIDVRIEDVAQKNDHYLNVINLFPESLNVQGKSQIPCI